MNKLAIEARIILYAFKLRISNTITALECVSMIDVGARKVWLSITIAGYKKATAMSCMNLLVAVTTETRNHRQCQYHYHFSEGSQVLLHRGRPSASDHRSHRWW
jgi:hypothetical protein